MKNIAVVGSSYWKNFTERINARHLFDDVQLNYIEFNVQGADTFEWAKIIEEIENNNVQILVVGPANYHSISSYVKIPCYVMRPNIQDFLLLHNEIANYENTAVLLAHTNDIDLSILEKTFNIKYQKFFYRNENELKALLYKLKGEGYTKIISNSTGISLAKNIGMETYYYYSQKSFEDGISNAIQMVNSINHRSHYESEIRTILENTTCGVIFTNGIKPIISYVNKTALDILRQRKRDLLQKPLKDILPINTTEQLLSKNETRNHTQLTICNIDVVCNIVQLKIQNDAPSICLMFEKTSNILEYEAMIRRESKRKNFTTKYSFNSIIGCNKELKKSVGYAKRYAESNSTVLISAETGVGKELFAQSIHNSSQRCKYPFIAISCASIPDTLIESELFGYEPGAFTGAATKGKTGLIELANHGTVFLDDIDALSQNFQSKLLRVIQEREIIRVGGNNTIPVDIRFIAATNRDLKQLVDTGEFRDDLYYRINVLHLNIPPLRLRPDDIPKLYCYYLRSFNIELYNSIKDCFLRVFTPAFSYSHPGNIRELISITERFSTLVDTKRLSDEQYLMELVKECIGVKIEAATSITDVWNFSGDYKMDIEHAEKLILRHYLVQNNNMTKLAELLGISRTTLYNKLRTYNLLPDSVLGN